MSRASRHSAAGKSRAFCRRDGAGVRRFNMDLGAAGDFFQ
jgi:hypothetical protein